MKTLQNLWALATRPMAMLLWVSLSAAHAGAAVRYVNVNGASPNPPYTTWAGAATNIQDAIDAAGAGDEIVVTNGVYETGGRPVDGTTTNRVAADKPVTVRSLNGPAVTVIEGASAMRCVYLTDNAALMGFTLTNGWAYEGGGVWCKSASAVVSNCVIAGNRTCASDIAHYRGGGAYGGTLNDCALNGNLACDTGGGACYSTLNNCTLTANVAYPVYFRQAGYGGGACDCTLNNCTLAGNSARGIGFGGFWEGVGGGTYGGTLNNCTLIGNSAYSSGSGGRGGGAANGTLNNCTVAGNSAQFGGGVTDGTLNNCIVYFNHATNGGDNCVGGVLNYCCTFPLPTNGLGNITNEPAFVDLANGNLRLQPGSPCIDAGTNLSAIITNDLDGRPRPLDGNRDGITAFEMGAYEYRALHVWQESPSPAPPYGTWATAATNIQDAIDAALPGDDIVVTNGVYQTGGRTVYGALTNRVAVTKPLTVRSVHGPEATVIAGYQVPGTITGDSAVRCVYLTNGASLGGFTLTNGATRDYQGDSFDEGSGGGVWCESANAVVSDCGLIGNSATFDGGGACGGTLNNCTLTHNSALRGGGASAATLNNCMLNGNSAIWGGGVTGGTLNNCRLSGNRAAYGGGARISTLNNCALTGNVAIRSSVRDGYGGGASGGTLNNCTLTGNSAGNSAQGILFGGGGGAYGAILNNCIAYYNTTGVAVNNYGYSTLNYSCTTPLPDAGTGNITNTPAFADYAGGNLRLQSISPCINAGQNIYVPGGTDLDGHPRIGGGTVDIGAYEFQSPQSLISYAWLQLYGLPIDSSTDRADPDGDGFDNWHEWRCGTNPTNALSVLRLLPPQLAGADLRVTWESVPGRGYVLEGSADLSTSASFAPLASNLPADPVAGTTTFTHTNAVGPGPWFYRVRVEE